MKHIFILTSLLLTSVLFAGHHESGESKDHTYGFVYTSDYTIPSGEFAQNVEQSILDNLEILEGNGYYNCGLLRHQFGGERGYYSYCYFDDWDHFAKINDSLTPQADEPRQVYGDHSDHLIAINERNLTERTPYILRAEYTFGPFLTVNEMRERAQTLFDAYSSAFGGCNLAEHAWGPDMAWYFYCGYESYADFAKKSAKLMDSFENGLADMKLDVRNHSDDLLVRIK